MELISIIVPIYNSEMYLKRCLDSILHQSYKNIEIILIDDGSTDESAKICDKYLELDNRIVVVHIKNQGVSNARNLGMKISKGKFYMFVDADDWIDLDMVEKMSLYIDDSDIVIAGLQIRYSKYIKNNIPTLQTYISKEKFLEDFDYLYKSTIINSPCAKIYKKKVASGILFDTSIQLGEDFDFNLRYLSYCDVISVVDNTKYIYDCTVPASATKKYRYGALQELLLVNERGHQFCIANKINNQCECLDEYLCYNGIHMLNVLANSNLNWSEKKKEAELLLTNEHFIQSCKNKYVDISKKNIIAKNICLLNNYFLLYLYFKLKDICKNGFIYQVMRKD